MSRKTNYSDTKQDNEDILYARVVESLNDFKSLRGYKE